MGLKPYLQLVRLPNLFTAAADPLAGFLIVGGALADVRSWLPLMLAGVAIYAGGMVLNDAFDCEVDRVERPMRPLPSGRISRRFAAWLGAVLLIAGPCLAALTGPLSLMVAVVLSACVLGYDGGLKRTWLGPEVMGACRSLNLLLGLSIVPTFGGPLAWIAAALFGLFVCGVTWISREEATTETSVWLKRKLIFESTSMFGWFLPTFGLAMRSTGDRVLATLSGAIVLSTTMWIVGVTNLKASAYPSSSSLQAVVKTGIFSLIWLDVSLVAASRGPTLAMSVAVLWIPAYVSGKWLYST